MIASVFYALVLGLLPGAAILRLPIVDRHRRETLDPAERVFWAVVISLSISLALVMLLAAAGSYRLRYVLMADALIAAGAVAGARRRLRYERPARATWWTVAPVALLALTVWVFPPPAEYIVGGKDPGVYLNAGVQIAQRGNLIIEDPVVSALPAETRSLFFPQHRGQPYFSNRFMGFFLVDPDKGTVIDQFPHLFPAAVAIGYDLWGLTGARYAVTACAMLGVLALYFLGARLAGPAAGAGAAGLLALHLIQVWHARIPNSEVLAQAMLLSGLLALARAHQDEDDFFAPVAGALLGLVPFARFDGVLAIGLAGAGVAAYWLVGGRVRWAFMVPLGGAVLAFVVYLLTWLAPYAVLPRIFIGANRTTLSLLAGAVVLMWFAGVWFRRERWFTDALRRYLPHALTVVVVGLACYAWFLRQPAGRLALHDAHAFRMFGWYVHPAAIAASLAGLGILGPRLFWRDPAFFVTACGSAIFVFYRIRIVPEHFWVSRRFVAIVLPAVLLALASTLLVPLAPRTDGRAAVIARYVLRLAVLTLVAWGFWDAARPLRAHVEFAGVIPRLEAIASRVSDRDLVVVESRNASDLHVLALPLAYVYDRAVLVLNSPKPDKARFEVFLGWARSRYDTVYFIGGGGTDLLSRSVAVESVASERFQIPEYESLRNAYPTRVRQKEFDFGIYRFVTPVAGTNPSTIDIGDQDDLQVVRFHAKERDARGTYRWTRASSYLSLIEVPADARELVLWMDNGGRPAKAPPAEVEVLIGETSIGRVTVASGMAPYALPIPPEVAAQAAASPDAVTVRLRTVTWRPREILSVADDRELGVMVDRVEIRRGP
jgi:hypothetical protein